jgi:hypothetical protein
MKPAPPVTRTVGDSPIIYVPICAIVCSFLRLSPTSFFAVCIFRELYNAPGLRIILLARYRQQQINAGDT